MGLSVASVAVAAGVGIGFSKVVHHPLLAAATAVGELDHRVELGGVSAGFFRECAGVDLELFGGECGLEQSCASEPLSGDVEAFDGLAPYEDGDGGVDGHRVCAWAEVLAQVVAGEVDFVLLVRLVLEQFVESLDEGQGRVAPFQEHFLDPLVGVVEEHFAGGRLAVASGAASFLVVGFDGAGDFEVYHEANVRPVDAHAECVGGNGDVGFPADELFLHAVACIGVHTSVVGDVPDGGPVELFGNAFHGLAGGAVDDPGAVLLDEFEDAVELVVVGVGGPDVEG